MSTVGAGSERNVSMTLYDTHGNKAVDDLEAYFYGAATFENHRKHGNTLFGKYVGQLMRKF
jgi:hypothetical protein